RRPASVWAARFFGLGNIVAGCWRADGAVETALGALACRADGPPGPPGSPVTLVIYPDAARPAARGDGALVVTLAEEQFRGRAHRVQVRHASGLELSFDLPEAPGRVGDTVTLALDPAGAYALAEQAPNPGAGCRPAAPGQALAQAP
ncbi:MAG: TOBE domain-containing protein, partial [Chloroflexales bacterium]|nr:TOBE domain-containing protein [Chloroflexales bacterium]